ncbi:MAG: hypothetical protein WC208_08620 [Gallionella sp.]|jgi:hypothetical protein
MLGKINNSDATPRITTSYGTVNLVFNATATGLVPAFSVNAAARNAIIFANLPCDIVSEVDNKIDDGNTTATGRAIGTACTNNVVSWYAVAL